MQNLKENWMMWANKEQTKLKNERKKESVKRAGKELTWERRENRDGERIEREMEDS
jgi:hypothetical protein